MQIQSGYMITNVNNYYIRSNLIQIPFNIKFQLFLMNLKQGPHEPTRNANQTQGEDQPSDDRLGDQEYNFQYYEEYRRLYQTAFLLSMQLKQLSQNKQDLWTKLGKLQKETEDFKDDIRGEAPERKKRFRRTAQSIQRPYTCQVQRCQKCYGSQGSLQQHIKLKHPQIYESKSQNRRESAISPQMDNFEDELN